jgi:hypothetical protein
MRGRLGAVSFLMLAVGGIAAEASVLCQKHSGALFVRESCRKKETAVEPKTLGLVTQEENGGRVRAFACTTASADGTLIAPCPGRAPKNVTLSTGIAPNATCFNLDPSIDVQSAVPIVSLADTNALTGQGVNLIVSVINGGFAVCGPNAITVFTGRYAVTGGVETFTPVRLALTLVVF